MKTDSINSFDRVAPLYDQLARFVFGGSIRSSQLKYLREISTAETILIIGGGTGWLLEEVLKINNTGFVWYIEASRKMLEKAQFRCKGFGNQRVVYTHGTELTVPATPIFDAVIANFFLDVFTAHDLDRVITRVKQSLRKNGIFLCADFNAPIGWWQRLLMTTMYSFFGVTTKLKTIDLPPWQELLKRQGFQLKKSTTFFKGFISSTHYSVEKL